MNSCPSNLKDLQDRFVKLEKQNRRFKRVGTVALIVAAAVVVMGQTRSKKTVEANEFILRDDGGNVRAKLSMNPPESVYPAYPSLVLFDDKGKQRVQIIGDQTASGLVLFNSQGGNQASFSEVWDGGLIELRDRNGTVTTQVDADKVLSNEIDTKHVETSDAGGFQAILGTAELITPRTGEKYKTSAASLVLLDKDNNVIWKAP